MDRKAKQAMAHVAYALWDAVLIGNAPPASRATYQRMRSPRPGDLVMETSTVGRLLRFDPDLKDDLWDGQFVPFLREEQRPIPGDHPYTETAYICENPDGTEFAWTNADLVAIPSSLAWRSEVSAITDEIMSDLRPPR